MWQIHPNISILAEKLHSEWFKIKIFTHLSAQRYSESILYFVLTPSILRSVLISLFLRITANVDSVHHLALQTDHDVSETESIAVHNRKSGKARDYVGPLERKTHIHRTSSLRNFPGFFTRAETDPVSETLASAGNNRWWTKTVKLVIRNESTALSESFRTDSSSFEICWHVELNTVSFQYM
jgi:hypothetical protein